MLFEEPTAPWAPRPLPLLLLLLRPPLPLHPPPLLDPEGPRDDNNQDAKGGQHHHQGTGRAARQLAVVWNGLRDVSGVWRWERRGELTPGPLVVDTFGLAKEDMVVVWWWWWLWLWLWWWLLLVVWEGWETSVR